MRKKAHRHNGSSDSSPSLTSPSASPSPLVTSLLAAVQFGYDSLRAGLIFLALLLYESMMCIVEAMLQVAQPEVDLRSSSVAVRVATIEQRRRAMATPQQTVIATPTIVLHPSKLLPLPAISTPSQPAPKPISRPRTPEPTILIPEIVPYVSLEQVKPLSSPIILKAPPAPAPPVRSPSPVPSSSSSSVEMSTPEVPEVKSPEPAEAPKTPPPTPSAGQEQAGPTLAEIFKAFAKFGDCKSDGSAITLSNSDKWFKQAALFDGKTLTTTDSGIYWKQAAKTKRSLSYGEYLKFLEALAKAKKIEIADLKAKLKASGTPSTSNATHAQSTGAFSRLTDHTKYTGSHKQRFDEAGKGRGKAGREDIIVNTGYVNGFKQ